MNGPAPTAESLPQTPSALRADWERRFLRAVLFFDRKKMRPLMAIRNTAGVVLPLIAGYALGMPRGGLAMASGALNVSYSDGSDPYATRARRMLTSAVWCAVAVFLGSIAGRYGAATTALICAWTFIAGMLTALGSAAADVGVISAVTLIVYSAQHLNSRQAALSALLALAGGLLQTGLSIALWPVQRHEPERRALGAFYSAIARLAREPAVAAGAPPATAESVNAHEALSGFLGSRDPEELRYVSLLTQAERLRVGIVTLARLRRRLSRDDAGHAAIKSIDNFLENAARIVGDLAAFLSNSAALPSQGDRLTLAVALAYQVPPDNYGEVDSFAAAVARSARHQMDALSGQLRTMLDFATRSTPEGAAAFEEEEARQPWWGRFNGRLAILLGNSNLHSGAFRHALRLAGCAALGDALGRLFESDRAYWISMTVVIVLKPEFTVTFVRGILRIAGTVTGLVLATALFHFLPIHTASEIALIGLCTFLMRWLGPANYGVFGICVSALVVLLLAITGVSPNQVIHARGLNTLIGGVLALAAYAVWPTWERTRIPDLFAALLKAYRESFHAITQNVFVPGTVTSRERDRVHQGARTARSNLEASLERLSAEPGTSPEQRDRWNAMLATSHRFAHAMMALEAGITRSAPPAVRPEFRRFRDDVEQTLFLLQWTLEGRRVQDSQFPDLREAHNRLLASTPEAAGRYTLTNVETDRMTNSLNTLREQIQALTRPNPGASTAEPVELDP